MTTRLNTVGSRDPVYNFLCCWAIEVGVVIGDVIVEKVTNIDQNSRSETDMFSFQIVDRIRRQLSWASCELCSHRRRRRDSTGQLRRVGGVYGALGEFVRAAVCCDRRPSCMCVVV